MCLPKMHNVPPDVVFESSKSRAKSESCNSPNLHFLHRFPHDNFVCNFMYDECKRLKRDNRWSQALVRFVIERASLFTDHKISGRPIRAKYQHFKTISEHTFDNSPTDFVSSSLKWWSLMHGGDTL